MQKRVLVIDDNQDFCEMMRELLVRAGYEVEASPSPINAVAEALDGQYDLITLDVKMPDFGGSEVMVLLKEERLSTPVLVISGYLNEEVIQELRRVGVEDFLEKPFESSELLEAVRSLLGE